MPILDNGIARSQIGRLDLTVVTLILRSLLRCFDGFSAMFYCEYYQTAELISGINPVRIILVTCFNCSRFKFHRLWIYAKQSRKRREILYTTNNLSTTRQSWVDLYVMRLPKSGFRSMQYFSLVNVEWSMCGWSTGKSIDSDRLSAFALFPIFLRSSDFSFRVRRKQQSTLFHLQISSLHLHREY